MNKKINIALSMKVISFIMLVLGSTSFLITGEFGIWSIIRIIIAVIIDLQTNITLIKIIKKDNTIRSNQKIVKIFKSTIWMLNITTFFWIFLIKKEKNNEDNVKKSPNNFND